MNPQTATPDSCASFGRSILNELRQRVTSFEEAAQAIVEKIYTSCTLDDGSPAFALVRIYRLTPYEQLPPELRAHVNPADERWLTLMGTYGREAAWCSRHRSQAHKVMSLGRDISPMMAAALSQLEPSLQVQVPPDIDQLPESKITSLTHYFHIPEVLGSPYIPDQETFVKPYALKSLVGLGNGFLSGSVCFVVGFSTVPLGAAQAEAFANLAPYIGTLLAIWDSKKIWA